MSDPITFPSFLTFTRFNGANHISSSQMQRESEIERSNVILLPNGITSVIVVKIQKLRQRISIFNTALRKYTFGELPSISLRFQDSSISATHREFTMVDNLDTWDKKFYHMTSNKARPSGKLRSTLTFFVIVKIPSIKCLLHLNLVSF